MKIELKILNKEIYKEQSDLPKYATKGSVGIDLKSTESLTIYPGDTKQIKTGIAIHIGSATIPYGLGYAGVIVPRSGMGSKGLVLANTIGIIDEDYQGELLINATNRLLPINLTNSSNYNSIKVNAGERIAQLLLVPVMKLEFDIVEEFSYATNRGDKGFGSTGV